MIVFGKAKALGFAQPNIQCANVGEAIAAQGGKRRAQRGRALTNTKPLVLALPMHTSLALPTPRPMLTAMCWGLGKSVFARAPTLLSDAASAQTYGIGKGKAPPPPVVTKG